MIGLRPWYPSSPNMGTEPAATAPKTRRQQLNISFLLVIGTIFQAGAFFSTASRHRCPLPEAALWGAWTPIKGGGTKFSREKFAVTGANANGMPLDCLSPVGSTKSDTTRVWQKLTMRSFGKALATPSSLESCSAASGFSVTWNNSGGVSF